MNNREALAEIKSPCVANCCLDADDICLGCFRSLDDILVWSEASNIKRSEIIKLASERSLKHKNKCPRP